LQLHDAVGRSRSAQRFILAHDRRCRVLGDHQSRIQARIRCEEGWQSALSANQLINTPFGNTAQFRQGEREMIERQGERLGMKVAPRHNQISFRENIGIIGLPS
jgi:hypothetical protein